MSCDPSYWLLRCHLLHQNCDDLATSELELHNILPSLQIQINRKQTIFSLKSDAFLANRGIDITRKPNLFYFILSFFLIVLYFRIFLSFMFLVLSRFSSVLYFDTGMGQACECMCRPSNLFYHQRHLLPTLFGSLSIKAYFIFNIRL